VCSGEDRAHWIGETDTDGNNIFTSGPTKFADFLAVIESSRSKEELDQR
jgi:hypothetical protein